MKYLFSLIAFVFLFSACKKDKALQCIKDFEEHEYRSVLISDNFEMDFDDTRLDRSLLSNEMQIRLNGYLNDGFTATVSDDCSFVINENEIILLPNSDTLFVDNGAGDFNDENAIVIDFTTVDAKAYNLTINKK